MNLTFDQLATKRIHFMGAGGAGMSGIARIMLAHGFTVSGCDAKDSTGLELLARLGAQVSLGHSESHIDELSAGDVLVVSTAINKENPELKAAQDRGVNVIHRAHALAILISPYRSIAIAGTHGKTTTTSMVTVALQHLGADPSFSIGGAISAAGVNGHKGSGKEFVVEADESDGSFLIYHPWGAVITNIELDHVDHFKDIESINKIFDDFVSTIQPGGFLVACVDSPGVNELLARVNRTDITIRTYGESGEYSLSHISLQRDASYARIIKGGVVVGELELRIPGRHNLDNALASIATCIELGYDPQGILNGLATFTGARRRFEVRGSVNNIRVIDDYGHHPTEIAVTIKAARQFAPSGKIIVIFQPHRYSRTSVFAQEFAEALSLADEVYCVEIYAASEAPIPGVTTETITQKDKSGKIRYLPNMLEVAEKVAHSAKSGDLIILLGAGDVNTLAPYILDLLAQDEK